MPTTNKDKEMYEKLFRKPTLSLSFLHRKKTPHKSCHRPSPGPNPSHKPPLHTRKSTSSLVPVFSLSFSPIHYSQ